MFRRFRRVDEVIGFAFSGGGSRAASQIGAYRALHEAGIRPQLLAGTSAGAVNAAWLALHPQDLDQLTSIWMGLRTKDVFPGHPLRLLLNISRRGYLHEARAWELFLRRHVGSATFEEATTPCAVTAVRLRDGESVVFDSGEIVPAVMASTAIPGVFPPYEIDGALYVDGGVLEYLPLKSLFDRGASTIWALDCSSFTLDAEPTSSVVDRVSRIAAYHYVKRETSLFATRGQRVHLLRPELREFSDGRDFRYTAELIEAGYTHARAYIESAGAPSRAMTAQSAEQSAG